MSHIWLAVEISFESTPTSTDTQFEAFLGATVEELAGLGRQVDLAASLTLRTAEFVTEVAADTFETAVAAFLPDLRTALHAAGGGTAGWPVFEAHQRVVRELQDA